MLCKAPGSTKLLSAGDPKPVGVRNGEAASPFLMISDHAGNAVPAALDQLGLPQDELDRHIGYDIGILGVSERLSDLLRVPLIFQRYSRLVVESNRRFTSPDSIAPTSDGTVVPGNAVLGDEARRQRIDEIVEPYHREISGRLDKLVATPVAPILISMHSFAPMLRVNGSPRPWPIGLCYGDNRHFSDAVLACLDREPDLMVGRNEPYGVSMLKDYSIPVHAEERGIAYVEIEIRQDLIATAEGQTAWAERLDRILQDAFAAYTGAPL